LIAAGLASEGWQERMAAALGPDLDAGAK